MSAAKTLAPPTSASGPPLTEKDPRTTSRWVTYLFGDCCKLASPSETFLNLLSDHASWLRTIPMESYSTATDSKKVPSSISTSATSKRRLTDAWLFQTVRNTARSYPGWHNRSGSLL